MEIISANDAPQAIGPYSQAIKAGNFIFTSGQIPIDPISGNIVDGGIESQTERLMKNLGAVLAAAGSGFEYTVKTTCYLADMKDFAAFNVIYAKYFVTNPARSCVAVKELPKGALAEVEVVAQIKTE